MIEKGKNTHEFSILEKKARYRKSKGNILQVSQVTLGKMKDREQLIKLYPRKK